MVKVMNCWMPRGRSGHLQDIVEVKLACVDIIPATKQDEIESESESGAPESHNQRHGLRMVMEIEFLSATFADIL
ncbi:hypothetical protein L2E82_01474 [Cichorium intybus]|uniref:Uncharacterized protein n=1 Tax=Cichorium intybus TaxID=13427 RepID=A0ACB9H041_CICIN|nr:hypothetical protein L2E82_01474 [Cichorium intybus]